MLFAPAGSLASSSQTVDVSASKPGAGKLLSNVVQADALTAPIPSVHSATSLLFGQNSVTLCIGLLLAVSLVTLFAGVTIRNRYPLAIAGFASSSCIYLANSTQFGTQLLHSFSSSSVPFALVVTVIASELLTSIRMRRSLQITVIRSMRFVQVLLVLITIVLLLADSQLSSALLEATFLLCVFLLLGFTVTSLWMWRRGSSIAIYTSAALFLAGVTLFEHWRMPGSLLSMQMHWMLALTGLVFTFGYTHRAVRSKERWTKTLENAHHTDRMVRLESTRREFSKEVELFLNTVSPKDYEEVVHATFLAHLDRIITVHASAIAVSHRGNVRFVSRFPAGNAKHFSAVLRTRENLLESICLSDRAAVIHVEDLKLQGRDGDLSTLCVVPVPTERNEWSGVVLARSNEQGFEYDEMTLVKDFSEYVQDAMRNAINFGQLRRQAETDALTGLFNRGAIMARADRAFKKARSLNNMLSLLFIDIDDFKLVNDVHGHEAGDKALHKVANICKECVRDQDALGRFGGEEFVAILPGADAQQANLVAERIRETVAASQLEVAGQSIQFTLSIGISEIAKRFNDVEGMLRAADRALYAAKRDGRNRVVHHLHMTRGAK